MKHHNHSESGYVIFWYSRATGFKGLGTVYATASEIEAKALCAKLNQEHPEIEHFPVYFLDKSSIPDRVKKWKQSEGQTLEFRMMEHG